MLPLLVNNFKVKKFGRGQHARPHAHKVASQWIQTLSAIMNLPVRGSLPASASAQQRMFTVPAQVKEIFAPFKDNHGRESMVVPFLKEVARANQISMKLGCASVALNRDLLQSQARAEGKATSSFELDSTLETSAYIHERCRCWFAALEDM